MSRQAIETRLMPGSRMLVQGLCLALVGCGGGIQADYSQLGLVEVSGKVTLDGQPLGDAVVVFEDSDGTFSFGQTDASGQYRLMFNSEKSGVLPGEKIVRIRTGGGVGEDDAATLEDDASPKLPDERVPACYNRQSLLRVEVGDGSDRFNFDLKSDGSVNSAK